jgi:RNA polymerase sigma-70 factor (ECF subfamily)
MGTIKPKSAENGEVSARDKSTFTRIFNWLYKKLCAFAATIVKCKQKAHDAVSEAFISLWEKALTFDTVQSVRNWLYRATKYSSLNLAKRHVYAALPDSVVDTVLTDDDGTHRMEREAALDQIDIAVRNLTPELRTIFLMTCKESKSNDDVAKELNLSYKTVANRKSLALSEIRDHLRSYRLSHT